MKQAGLSKRQLSVKLGIPYNTVVKWWHRDPSADHILKIRGLLDSNESITKEISHESIVASAANSVVVDESAKEGIIVPWNNRLDAARSELTFTCKSCGKVTPIEEIRVVMRFFSPLTVCKECSNLL
jgi:ribosome-binding protein aMBF1 (putative translation factor)